MKIEITILVIDVLLMPYFIFKLISGISNQAGILSPIYSGFMVLLLIVSATLIINHWKTEKNVSKFNC